MVWGFTGTALSTTALPTSIRRSRTFWAFRMSGVPSGSRTRVTAVKGRCPRPLDDRDALELTLERQVNFAVTTSLTPLLYDL